MKGAGLQRGTQLRRLASEETGELVASLDEFYGARSMNVIDPFGNRISFNEFKQPHD